MDNNPTITGGDGSQSITVSATGDNQANLTIENVNAKTIEVGESNATISVSGSNTVTNDSGAGIHVSSGDLTITCDGTLEAKTNNTYSAAIGSNYKEDMSGSITIGGSATVTGISKNYGAGIGTGNGGTLSGSITIQDQAQVTGKVSGEGTTGAGIGTGGGGELSGSITIGDDAKVTGDGIGSGSNIGAGIGTGCNGNLSGSITIKDNAIVEGTGSFGAGIGAGCNYDNDITTAVTDKGSITIEDNAKVIGTSSGGGAGIGSGQYCEMSGTITIGGTTDVTATATGNCASGAGIGSGAGDGTKMSGTISISTKATVDASSTGSSNSGDAIGAGAFGANSGTIRYFDPDAVPTQPEPNGTAVYQVVNEDGISMGYTSAVKDGVLTITVKGDYARLTGSVASLATLASWGYSAITLVTKSATSTFALADLQAKGTGTYTLTHDGETVTFTLAKADVSDILK